MPRTMPVYKESKSHKLSPWLRIWILGLWDASGVWGELFRGSDMLCICYIDIMGIVIRNIVYRVVHMNTVLDT